MHKQFKFALLAAVAGASLTAANAGTAYNGHLIIGFTKSSGNDLIYDIGAASSLTNGQTWDLSSLLSSYTLSTVNWGVIGDVNSGTPRQAWTTTGGVVPPAIPNAGTVNAINTAIKSIYQNVSPTAGTGNYASVAVTDDNSWKSQTITPSLTTQYANVIGGNPNVEGLTAASLFYTPGDNTDPQLLGTFTLAANGVVTFNTVANTAPVPKIVAVTRTGNTSTIYFTTTNTFTYSLYFTNSAGLGAATATWAKSASTVTGPGSGVGATNSIADTTTDPIRFYRVSAQ